MQREAGLVQTYIKLAESAKRYLVPKGRWAFVCCMPKSGSTYLCNLLSAATGWPIGDLVYRYGQNEPNLYRPRLVDNWHRNLVIHQHCKHSVANEELMKVFGMRPILHVRNIFDVAVSFTDFSDSTQSPKTFPCHFGESYTALSREERLDFIVELAIPWFVGFFAAWYEVGRRGTIPLLWTTYEELMTSRTETLRRILDFINVPTDDAHIESAITAAAGGFNRFNKGVVGRGLSELSSQQVGKIRRFASFYPKVDFSLIGL